MNIVQKLDELSKYLPILKKEKDGLLRYTIDLGFGVKELGVFRPEQEHIPIQKEFAWIGLWMRILESLGWDLEIYTTKEGRERYYCFRVIVLEVPVVVEMDYPVRELPQALLDVVLQTFKRIEEKEKEKIRGGGEL